MTKEELKNQIIRTTKENVPNRFRHRRRSGDTGPRAAQGEYITGISQILSVLVKDDGGITPQIAEQALYEAAVELGFTTK